MIEHSKPTFAAKRKGTNPMFSPSRLRSSILGMLALLAILAQQGQAAKPGNVELGFDGEFSYIMTQSYQTYYGFRNPKDVLQFRFPSRVRLGVYLSETRILEFTPIVLAQASENRAQSVIGVAIGLGFHSQTNSRGKTRFFQPEAFIAGAFDDGGKSDYNFGLGLELGLKTRRSGALLTRISLLAEHLFETGSSRGVTSIGLSIGVSFLEK